MSTESINVTLGTAGHIDHGKTALVRCLTGCETDRLKAEKERGMSIDLGFAPCTIADLQVGIVDVPGHENFIKTMVAGATGMDGVVLVVAADDGVMPQTREHLDILTLLGVRHGIVALTKIDRVEPDHLQLARDELDEYLRGTFLEGAPVLPLSNVTGEGFDGFYRALESLVRSIEPKRVDGVFRVPLDRAFSAKGYGTVVAGIPVSGSARAGDEVVLLPAGLAGRIRQIEVYGRPSEVVRAGQCAAINVRHWEHQAIARGDTLAAPGFFEAHTWYVCRLCLLPQDKLFLKNGAPVKFHTGTAEVPAAVYALQGAGIRGGEETFVQVRANAPIVAGPGDHFIVRTLSPVRTIGGGLIVEGVARRLKRNRPHVYEDVDQRARAIGDARRFVEYCIRRAESLAVGETELAARAKVPHDRLREILAALVRDGKAAALPPSLYVHRDALAEAGGQVLDAVAEFHRRSPESPGMTLEQLRQACPFDRVVLGAILDGLKADGRLVERSQRLARREHEATFNDEDAGRLETIEGLFRQHAFHPPGVEELVDKTGADAKTVEKMLRILREHERLVAVGEGLLFHREAVERARAILVDFLAKEGRLESVRFKYLLDTTRKFALPLLDYFDDVGVTRRSGNTRYLKSPNAT